ncbi:hypothetical protein SAMN05428988_0381 [Chitinophaga sp. YR573]|uniref:hypothetical protein n=1 Tax=Chitinophaga sp. YR573 TaxID=1881040 RepID=UPI0008ADC602|nr:hypothetical protein [Chitinophaga sp. YR573]SEV91254.1 hypothetical protein SAMN05428988_0381 [Chitinophaga sp. YR573]
MKTHITIILLLTFFTFITLRTCFHKQEYINVTQDSAVYWKDKYNTEHISKMAGSIQKPSAFLNAVKKQVKQEDIRDITTVSSATTGFIYPKVDTVYLPDSTTIYKFSFHDQWLNLTGEIGKESVINYRFTDSIIITAYQKHKKPYVDAYSLNPNVHLTGITALRMINRQHFTIGPYAGYGWNGKAFTPSVGISLQYSFIKF